MGKINIYLEIAKEAERLKCIEGLEFKEALRIAKEKFLGDKRAPHLTDQSKNEEHTGLINNSIPQKGGYSY